MPCAGTVSAPRAKRDQINGDDGSKPNMISP
jgi:hypothetical protein